jgi:serine/threonine protein kinase
VDSQYELLEKLGGGGMGNVYRARDNRLNRIVAIKILKDAARDPDRQRRFILEAQAASALNHPNIITIHDLVEQDGEQMMVMECVTGRSLSDLIRDRPLTLEEVSHYGAQAADALATAHAAGIIHRDLKPSNVMVTDRGFVKVLDFGLAKLLAPEGSEVMTRSGAALTVEGTLLGTVAYMSPEQAQGKPVDARSDIFSFGAVLYEMVTGKRAFESGNVISTLTAILRDEARPIPELTANVPTELQAVVHYCLRKLPEERYQNMAQVRDALLSLRRVPQPAPPPNAGPPAPQPPPPPPPPPQPVPLAAVPSAPPPTAKKTRWALPVALLGLLAIGAGGWWFWSHRNSSSVPASKTPAVSPPAANPPVANPPVANPPGPTTPVPPRITQPPATSPPVVAPPAGQTPKPEAPPQPQPPPAAKSVTVPDGTPLRLTLAQDVPADAPEGTPLAFVVDADLVANGSVAIAKGAAAKGVIVEPGKKRRILRDLKATYRLISVDAVDGKSLRVRTTPARLGDAGKRPLIGTSKGTPFPAYVDGDVTVTVR